MSMRNNVLKLSIIAFMSAMEPASATDTAARFNAAMPATDFAFCLSSQASLVTAPQSSSEVGMVITNIGNSITNTSGTVVVAANNHYGSGAGSEWKSNFGVFQLSGGTCYNVSSMAKYAGPNGQVQWGCGLTSGSASISGATFSGVYFTETQPIGIEFGQIQSGVTNTLNNAPVVNCPY